MSAIDVIADAIEDDVAAVIGHRMYGHEAREVAEHVASRLVQAGQIIVPTTLLSELVDPDDCWFDHHGGCQAHGYISLQPGQTCPVHDAKTLLAADASATTKEADNG
ncbi:hypothetical protein [Rhodococcoides fascians]|uniref:hypothetical protein n=1 Tax=Rhodococcoides fascians TaxID=1828 RepID=UPI00055E2685|nr:hypothetical protein [Rhodococcus fascians]